MGEFKDQCQRLHLGLLPHEQETIFTAIIKSDGEKHELSRTKSTEELAGLSSKPTQIRGFTYRQFVRAMYKFRNPALLDQILAKTYRISKERKISWKQHFSASAKDSKSRPGDLSLHDLKILLRNLKVGLTPEEIDVIINSFEMEVVSQQLWEQRLFQVFQRVENASLEKEKYIHQIVAQIKEAVKREKIQIDRLFFDFDDNQSGSLEVRQLSNLLQFLKVSATKHQLHNFFDAIDLKKKGYISLLEFKNFLETSSAKQQQVSNQKYLEVHNEEEARLEPILLSIKDNLQKNDVTLQKVIENLGYRPNDTLNRMNLEKLLFSIQIVLKRDDLDLLYDRIAATSSSSIITLEDLQSYAIREKIEAPHLEERHRLVHPAISVYIEKMNFVFRNVQVIAPEAFKYFSSDNRDNVSKKAFLKVIQTLGIVFTKEELLIFYEFFDEKGYGEISNDVFSEKFEAFSYISINKLQSQIGEPNESEKEETINLKRISMKQQVMGLLQKIYQVMLEKRYSRRQMAAVFDKNGNGMLNREDFMEGLKGLRIDIPLEKASILMNFLDKNNNGIIEIEEYIQALYESVPQNMQESFKMAQAMKVLKKVIDRMAEEAPTFLGDIVKFEKIVNTSSTITLSRSKTGIYALDFFKLVKDYKIAVSEEDKGNIKGAFTLKSNSHFFDIELLYTQVEALVIKRSAEPAPTQVVAVAVPTEKEQKVLEFSDQIEKKIFKKIGEELRKRNVRIEEAFKEVDEGNKGHLTLDEFKQLTRNLDIQLSMKETNLITLQFNSQLQGQMTFETFKKKFLKAYAESGFIEGHDRLKHTRNYQRKVVSLLLHSLKDRKKCTMEYVWDMIDRSKVGYANLEELRRGLIDLHVYVSSVDLASLFSFMDEDLDGTIDLLDFIDFWHQTYSIYDLTSDRQNLMKVLEKDILTYLAKVINQKEISIYELYSEADSMNKGYVSQKDFNFILRRLGQDLPDVRVEQLMRLIDSSAEKKITFSELETKLLQYGMRVFQGPTNDRVLWVDKSMKKLLVALNQETKDMPNYLEYFRAYDKDHDGYLTPEEFYKSIKNLQTNISEDQLQRLGNNFQTKERDNRISMERITEILNYANRVQDSKGQQFEVASMSQDLFTYLMTHYEGLSVMFTALGGVQKSMKDLDRYLKQRRPTIRGFKLFAFQEIFNGINRKFQALERSLNKGLCLTLRQSNELIVNSAFAKYIDPATNAIPIDKDQLRLTELMLQHQQIIQLTDYNAFSMDQDSLEYATPYIRKYKGYFFRNDQPVEIQVYDKNVLMTVCKDGNQFIRHLDFELRVSKVIADSGDYMFQNYAKFEKRVGLEASEKEIYVINEYIDPAKWISLEDLIMQNGGLLRIPFLTRTKASIYIIKYWASQILEIMHAVQEQGCALMILRPDNIYVSRDGQKIKFKSLKGVGRINDIGRISFGPDFKLNLKEASGQSAEAITSLRSVESEAINLNDAYLAPEMIFNNVLELTQSIDTWAFGCLLYHILFGKPPTSFYSRVLEEYPKVRDDIKSFTYPSDYFVHDIYPDSLINDILKCDYELHNIDTSQLKAVDAVKEVSYNSLFKDVIKPDEKLSKTRFDKTNKEMFHQIGCYLDIIAACLSYSPSRRPTIYALMQSPIFNLDKYESMISKQYSEIMIFYKSPSLNVRDRILIPLRRISSLVINDRRFVVTLEDDLLAIMDIVIFCLTEHKPVKSGTKKLATKTLNTTMRSHQTETKRSQDVSSLNQTATSIKQTEKDNAPTPSQILAKFLFENYVMDLLVFLTLRHHTESRRILISGKEKGSRTYEDTVRLVKGLTEVFRTIILDMTRFENACAPFVHLMLESLCKLVLGEEYRLASDAADIRDYATTAAYPHKNTFNEYTGKTNPLYTSFFRRPDDPSRDEADEAWLNYSFPRPFIFSESHWTPDLYLIVGPLYKDSVSEAGTGSGNFVVIQDYIRRESENVYDLNFDLDRRVNSMNKKITSTFRRSAEYFNDILHLAENLQVLHQYDSSKGKANLRVSFQYIKALLQSNNTDKIKLVLDSKIIVYLVKFLGYNDVHIRRDLLEILYEVSHGFERDLMSLNARDRNEVLRGVDEHLKTIGLVSQLNKQPLKDKGSQTRVISYSYDYAALNRQVNYKYMKEMAQIFESPVTITLMFSVLKTQAELIENKEYILKIFENLTNGPMNVIRALNGGYMDSILTLGKTLIMERRGMELKQNKILAPKLVPVFQKLINDCRPELIDMITNIPSVKSLLRERGLEVPTKLNLTILHMKLNNLMEFFDLNKDIVVQEIESFILAVKLKHKNPSDENLGQLAAMVDEYTTNIISWLKYYFNDRESNLTLVDVRTCFDESIKLLVEIFDHLSPYAQINDYATSILLQIAHLFEWFGTSEFLYIFLNTRDAERLARIMGWMMEKITEIYKYYQSLEKDERKMELDEREKEITISKADRTEHPTLVINDILNKDSIKRYSSNRLMPAAQAFMRIFLHLVTLNNDSYNAILVQQDFATFFANLCKEQYWVLMAAIKTHTENVHILMNYAEEASVRQKMFEKILMNSAKQLHQQIVSTGFIHLMCDNYLNYHHEMNASSFKLTYKVLPFRNFIPLRNEALSILISIIQHRAKAEYVYKDAMLALTRFNNMRLEYENLKKHQKGLLFTTALYFFNIIMEIEDQQVHFLMRQEGIYKYLAKLFEKNAEVRHHYPELAKKLVLIDADLK